MRLDGGLLLDHGDLRRQGLLHLGDRVLNRLLLGPAFRAHDVAQFNGLHLFGLRGGLTVGGCDRLDRLDRGNILAKLGDALKRNALLDDHGVGAASLLKRGAAGGGQEEER